MTTTRPPGAYALDLLASHWIVEVGGVRGTTHGDFANLVFETLFAERRCVDGADLYDDKVGKDVRAFSTAFSAGIDAAFDLAVLLGTNPGNPDRNEIGATIDRALEVFDEYRESYGSAVSENTLVGCGSAAEGSDTK